MSVDDEKKDLLKIVIETHESGSESYNSVDEGPNNKNLMLLSLNSPVKMIKNNKHRRVSSGTSDFLMTYSSGSLPGLQIEVDPLVVQTLQAKKKPVLRKPSAQRSASSLPFVSKSPKKKKMVRFNETVTIHRISVRKGLATPPSETFVLIAHLKEIWKKLDEDKDDFLNIKEFGRFVDEVWEEEDAEEMTKNYSANPQKGLNFTEWCVLLKEEDPELSDLIDDLYQIFVDESESEDDEKKAQMA